MDSKKRKSDVSLSDEDQLRKEFLRLQQELEKLKESKISKKKKDKTADLNQTERQPASG